MTYPKAIVVAAAVVASAIAFSTFTGAQPAGRAAAVSSAPAHAWVIVDATVYFCPVQSGNNQTCHKVQMQ